jgi:hypothetical protein
MFHAPCGETLEYVRFSPDRGKVNAGGARSAALGQLRHLSMTLEGNSERCVAENYRLCATPTIREPEHTCGGCGEGARGVREGAEAHL